MHAFTFEYPLGPNAAPSAAERIRIAGSPEMTLTPSIERIRCGVCGTDTQQYVLPDVHSSSPPDFDTRPAEPERSLLIYSVSRCHHCGYCANDLEAVHPGVADVIAEERYQSILNNPEYPDAARSFLCFSLLLERLHEWADAGWSTLHAAWVCDDAGAEAEATWCRQLALARWKRAKELGSSFSDDLATEFALATDLYRRSGDFTNGLVTCTEALSLEDLPALLEKALRRQYVLIQQQDTSAHSLSELFSSSPAQAFSSEHR